MKTTQRITAARPVSSANTERSARTALQSAVAARLARVAPAGQAALGRLVDTFSAEKDLSAAEAYVVRLAADGLTTRQIANLRQISTKTVDQYWARIYLKTGAPSQRVLLSHLLKRALAGKRSDEYLSGSA